MHWPFPVHFLGLLSNLFVITSVEMGMLKLEGSGVNLFVYVRPAAPKLTVSESRILRSELRFLAKPLTLPWKADILKD